MTVNIKAFQKATNPNKTLDITQAEYKNYYINFASVRGGEVIQKLKKKITFFSDDDPTCSLFTGHLGCGKSTELLKLKAELEEEGFLVVYFESSEDLEITDVDIADVFLVIARRIIQHLENNEIQLEAKGFRKLIQELDNVVNGEITGASVKTPVGQVGYTQKNGEYSLDFVLGKITGRTKSDSTLRRQLNQYIAPRKQELIRNINQDVLETANSKLKQQGKKGLVVIVDNLDRVENTRKIGEKSQQEYLFVDQGDCLKQLNCHVIYTMPLGLIFSNSYNALTQRFGDDPIVLPMVSIQHRDGSEHEQGMNLLKQMVLARAFPSLDEDKRLQKIGEIFDTDETLNHLCRVSGGHVRELLMLLNNCIIEQMSLPLTETTLEKVIRSRRTALSRSISAKEWDLLRDVTKTNKVSDDEGYQQLIRSLFVFEYQDEEGVWFKVNPILSTAKELQIVN